MKYPAVLAAALLPALALPSVADAGSEQCRQQAEQILARLQAEVVGALGSEQRAAANRIVLDVCEVRERELQAEVEAEVEQAVQEAREEEQSKGWWESEPANKPGNKRLKRKTP